MTNDLLQLTDLTYQTPPEAIRKLVEIDPTPAIQLSPKHDQFLFLERLGFPSIEEVAKKDLRLAGLRIDPQTNSRSQMAHHTNMYFQDLETGNKRQVSGLPKEAKIGSTSWSPNAAYIAFTNTTEKGVELWCVHVETASAERLTDFYLNDAISEQTFSWLSNGTSFLFKSILTNRSDAPTADSLPKGPNIQNSDGSTAPLRTYQDLLRNRHDEALFKYYTTAILQKIEVETKVCTSIGEAAMIRSFSSSPDGNYLLVSTLQEPFSYAVPYQRFPMKVDLYKGEQHLKTLVTLPLAEDIPKGFGAVRIGPRYFSWRADHPAQLYWVEAMDGGDPKKEATIRDQLYYLEAPFQGEPKQSISFPLRYGGIEWGNGGLALAYEWWWETRREVTSKWQPDQPETAKEIWFDRSWEDRYNSPGTFQTQRNEYGRSVLMTATKGHTFYLLGNGASPEGNRPFIDVFDGQTKQTERLWRSEAPYYEYPFLLLKDGSHRVLTSRESNTDIPNYYLRNLKNGGLKQLTYFPNPYESLKDIRKENLQYERQDGVQLTATLYLPSEEKTTEPIPVFMWAYPKEFKNKDTAGQVTNSPYEFLRLHWGSPLFWVTQGYAILDDFSVPIVGEKKEEPNETFIEQLQWSAAAAVNFLVERGVADPKKIAVGGHSYGAFMTANLLAHTDLFAAGIARSGAYNRTLTPFGFQSEERTFWEAKDTYLKMSPFSHAPDINAPLLLIHGDSDNNSGTYPMQSKRFFNALKGHGKIARLVLLPHESHGYRAKESILHMLWEMDEWLKKYIR